VCVCVCVCVFCDLIAKWRPLDMDHPRWLASCCLVAVGALIRCTCFAAVLATLLCTQPAVLGRLDPPKCQACATLASISHAFDALQGGWLCGWALVQVHTGALGPLWMGKLALRSLGCVCACVRMLLVVPCLECHALLPGCARTHSPWLMRVMVFQP